MLARRGAECAPAPACVNAEVRSKAQTLSTLFLKPMEDGFLEKGVEQTNPSMPEKGLRRNTQQPAEGRIDCNTLPGSGSYPQGRGYGFPEGCEFRDREGVHVWRGRGYSTCRCRAGACGKSGCNLLERSRRTL